VRFWKIIIICLSVITFMAILNYDSNHNDEFLQPKTVTFTPEPTPAGKLSGKVICIDPGHGGNVKSDMEPLAPGSDELKRAYVHGTKGNSQSEIQFNLRFSKMLEAKLKEYNATVHLTRNTNEENMANVDRAKFANDLNADLSIKIHADGNTDDSVSGIRMLVPSNKNLNNDEVYNKSKKAGEIILNSIIEATDAKSHGLQERDNLTGFNWSTVPVVLYEAGFLTNEEDDKLLDDDEYLAKVADAIANGVIKYFENSGTN